MIQTRLAELTVIFATGKRPDVIAAGEECLSEIRKLQRRRDKPRFTLPDVLREAEGMHWPAGLAEQCYDSFQEVGWVRGRNKIPYVDLPATMRNWRRRQEKWNGVPSNGNGTEPTGWKEFI